METRLLTQDKVVIVKLVDKAFKILDCSDEKILNARLIKVGLGKVCTRCGGTGQHSYNQRDGSVCYGCKGKGWVAQKVTKALVAALEEKEINGEIAAYLSDLEKRIEEKNWVNSHGFKYLVAEHEKTEISKYYNWMTVSEEMPELAAINKKFSVAITLASDANVNRIKASKGRISYSASQLKGDIKEANKLFEEALRDWNEYKQKYNPVKLR